MPSLMIQGCGSDVGKSVLVAGLCRLLTNRGHRVRPFKPQNMSNNAAVTADGGEIGRSTALQALACRVEPTVDMNPVLLKPQSETGAQLIVQGRRVGTMEAKAYRQDKRHLLAAAVESYRRLEAECEWMIVEGAGSPAETNLRANDIANMGFAHAVNLPVVLVGDIERGHVIAALIGAHAVLDVADRARVRGFIINKFRGDAGLFAEGLSTIEARTGWPSLGVAPWLAATQRLPAEDGMQIDRLAAGSRAHAGMVTGTGTALGRARVAILRLPHIANFDDFEPLAHEPGVELVLVNPGELLPLDARLVVIPGSKTTISDLQHLRAQGWDHDIHAYARRGGRVLGICAGYQMLGHVVRDPMGIEGSTPIAPGLGLLDIETTMGEQKTLRQIAGHESSTGARIDGYEMHLGISSGAATRRPMIRFNDGSFDGALSEDGRIAGCHIHGLFNSPAYRTALLSSLGAKSTGKDHLASIDAALDELATSLECALDVAAILNIAR